MNPSGTDTSQLSDRPEREKDTFLTARIFFSLDRCLLMGNPAAEPRGIISNGVNRMKGELFNYYEEGGEKSR